MADILFCRPEEVSNGISLGNVLLSFFVFFFDFVEVVSLTIRKRGAKLGVVAHPLVFIVGRFWVRQTLVDCHFSCQSQSV